MSDRVANSEIEDVLSSIRRLVGEEGRKVPMKQLKATDSKPDRLVLTPALRIGEAAENAARKSAETADAPPETEISRKKEPEAETDLAAGFTGGAGPEGSGDAGTMVLCPTYAVEPEDTSAQAAETDKSGDAGGQKPASAGRTGKSKIAPLEEELADSLSAKIEALETAIAQTDDQWEPDGDSDDAYAGTRVRRITLRLSAEPAELEPEPLAAGRDSPEPGDGPTAADPAQEDESAESEAVSPPQFVHIPTPEIDPDMAQEGLESSLKAEESNPEPDETDLDLGESLFDEEALRLMVADIVREELQGALGERITRNVRKLVRREIQNALASRNLK